MKKELLDKINRKAATIGVVGLGYVGLPLSLIFLEADVKVLGFDIDQTKVDALNQGRSYIEYIQAERIAAQVRAGRLEATSDFSRAGEPDALIICVPTPLNVYREPDLSFVINTIDSLTPHMRAGQMISLESTTYPGTTEEEIAPRVAARGLEIGRDVFVVYSPEREDPGNPIYGTKSIPKICGGVTEHCLDVGRAVYELCVDQVVPVSSTRVAELTKLLENIYRAVNIGLVNELKMVAERMNIDIHEVINAAATKPFGFTPFYPGPGLGGHCIPIDPFYLTWKAREFGVHTRFIELAGDINRHMPDYVVSRTIQALNARQQAINGSKLLILGLAYKKNVDDARESPSFEIIELFKDLGADIAYADPHIPVVPKTRRFEHEMTAVDVTADNLAAFDCVVLVTDHDGFDYGLIEKHARLIVDARGKFNSSDHVFRA